MHLDGFWRQAGVFAVGYALITSATIAAIIYVRRSSTVDHHGRRCIALPSRIK